MKKILLLDTSIATFNIGDEIINDSIKRNWPELFQKNYIATYPAHTPPYTWWQQLLFSKKFSNLQNVDYKFLCGTNALYTNMIRPLPVWNIYAWNAAFLRGTILLGVGAGLNSHDINFYTRKLYKKVLSKQYIHSVRDSFTEELLGKLGFKALNTGCPTLWGLTSDFCKSIPTEKSDNVLFTLTGKQPDFLNDKLMIEILSKNYKELYFWPQTITDLDYLNTLGEFHYKLVAPNLRAYDEVLTQKIDYVGSRLHGGIRALQHAKRSLIISIDYRAENMGANYSLPILKREDIGLCLETLINKSRDTMISGLNWDAINKWKAQFEV